MFRQMFISQSLPGLGGGKAHNHQMKLKYEGEAKPRERKSLIVLILIKGSIVFRNSVFFSLHSLMCRTRLELSTPGKRIH